MLLLIPLLVVSYLLGSIPTSILVARRWKGIDIRRHGSGNAGGTNVLRVVGWKAALLVASVDVGKGSLAACLPSFMPEGCLAMDTVDAAALCGTFAVVGHIFPIFAGFRGGKGIGTSAGMYLVTQPLAVALVAPVFFVAVLVSRMVSLGSVIAATSLPVALWLTRGGPWIKAHTIAFAVSIGLACLVVLKHWSNMVRIARGTENRLGGGKEKSRE